MRWVEHWYISKNMLPRKSLFYQLGSILPDWFERHPIHTRKKSLDRVLRKIEKVQTMKKGRRRDYLLGTITHYLEDYCCYAHTDVYFELYKHRVFEVESQKNFDKYFIPQLEVPSETDFCAFITKTAEEMEQYVCNLHNEAWYRDLRVMTCNVNYAYQLVYGMLYLLGECT